ncbi:pilin chaperone [Acinetobacter baumannii]|uniref:fimbrial biogenesis chaperone n=1 Tax=Serratia ureilytica TaxID=300181 RepID=UPI000B8E4905|nr:molecular chaperone [Serratia ureilytica]MEB5991836.1 molecular chaperone [Serratia ureilytica]SVK54386.1 pilin chaperone [Acinetobacter baumannii]
MKQSKYYLLAILFFSYGASASVTLGGTRIVYEESKKEANISVSNQDKNSPVLIQTWVESFSPDDKKEVPFIVTPPLFRLEAEQENILRVIYSGDNLPQHKESIYWLSVRSIPSTQKSKENKLLITVQNRIKIFYRPKHLSKDEAIDAYKKIRFSLKGKTLEAKNPTPFHVSFYSVSIDGKEVKEADMIAPQSTKKWLLPKEIHGKEIRWQAINDYGGITQAISAPL